MFLFLANHGKVCSTRQNQKIWGSNASHFSIITHTWFLQTPYIFTISSWKNTVLEYNTHTNFAQTLLSDNSKIIILSFNEWNFSVFTTNVIEVFLSNRMQKHLLAQSSCTDQPENSHQHANVFYQSQYSYFASLFPPNGSTLRLPVFHREREYLRFFVLIAILARQMW